MSAEGLDLLRALSYCADTGVFTWSVPAGRWGRIPAGTVAGSRSHGYMTVVFNGRRYPLHRVAWLFSTGSWPAGEIDHINGIRDDNRLCNLRDVPKRLNGQNRRRANKDNASCGLLGVTRNGRSGWMAQLTVDGRRVYLGTFRSPTDAHRAYVDAKRTMHAGCTI